MQGLYVLVILVIAFAGINAVFGLNTRASIAQERRLRSWMRRRASQRDQLQARRELESQLREHYNLKMHCRDRQVIAHRQPLILALDVGRLRSGESPQWSKRSGHAAKPWPVRVRPPRAPWSEKDAFVQISGSSGRWP